MPRAHWLILLASLSGCFEGSVIAAGGGGSGGAGASGGAGPAGGAQASGGSGGASSCDCVPRACEIGSCDAQGACVYTARSPGAECEGEPGVCQGGAYAGECGQRLSARIFHNSGPWTQKPVSDLFVGSNAPPVRGIVSAEETSDGNKLFVWADDGLVYLRKAGVWLPPKPFIDYFTNPDLLGCALAPSAPIASTFGGDVDNPAGDQWLTSTNQPGNVVFMAYTVSLTTDEFTFINCLPTQDVVGGPPEMTHPAEYAFVEQRAPYGTVKDALTAYKAHAGIVYMQYSGNSPDDPSCNLCYDPVSSPEATSLLKVDGQNGAPAPQTIEAAFHDPTTGVLYTIGD